MLYRQIAEMFPFRGNESPFSFRANTTVGIGGTAPLALFPETAEDCVCAVRFLKRGGVPYVLLGNGSNVLVSDKGFDGAVICMRRMKTIGVDACGVYAESGAALDAVVLAAAECGWGGLSFLCGIPATLGGALFMNAGARGKYMDSVVLRVDALVDGEKKSFSLAECGYSYKTSRFMQEDCVILGGLLRGVSEEKEKIVQDIRAARLARKDLPKGKSLGCVFRNPQGDSAGRLIEAAGLKGLAQGGAEVSAQHANFIINRGGATASDYAALVRRVKERVFSETGTMLAEEIRYIGEF